jgi:CRP/FNR family cyclic AMP-dependent transcriptional regulator
VDHLRGEKMSRAALEDVPLFSRLTEEELEELKHLARPASFDEGEEVFAEGEPEESFYALTAGSVEVTKRVSDGRSQLLAVLEAPTVIGEMGLLSEPCSAATVTVREPVEAHAITRESFLEKLESGSPAAYKVVHEIGRTLAERMAATDDSIAGVIGQIKESSPGKPRDFDLLRSKLAEEWSF